jgi:hypothetical protein
MPSTKHITADAASGIVWWNAAKPSLNKMAATAEALGVPLWVLFIPGLSKHRELLKDGALKPLQAIVQNYLESAPSRRIDIEETARVGARFSRPKTPAVGT